MFQSAACLPAGLGCLSAKLIVRHGTLLPCLLPALWHFRDWLLYCASSRVQEDATASSGSDDSFEAYCTELESTAAWGGQVELQARFGWPACCCALCHWCDQYCLLPREALPFTAGEWLVAMYPEQCLDPVPLSIARFVLACRPCRMRCSRTLRCTALTCRLWSWGRSTRVSVVATAAGSC